MNIADNSRRVSVVGVNAHKATHTIVGVDAVGRKLGELTVRATTAGHIKAVDWARRAFGTQVVWGIEECRHRWVNRGGEPAKIALGLLKLTMP